MTARCSLRILAALALCLAVAPAANATSIVVNNLDGAGEGFNDPTPRSPEGGNPGTTLGALRQNAFNEAADRWQAILSSPVVIQADGHFDPLTPCDSGGALLGFAGPNTVHRDFAGAPVAATWFSQAEANSLAGVDLSASSDLSATFNSDIDLGCLPGITGWYYGFDHNPPPGKLDFVPTLLHELAHGLGFLTFVDLASGSKLLGFDDTYMRFLENHSTGLLYPAMTNTQRVAASINTGNLHWLGPNVAAASGLLSSGKTGTHVQLYAPNPQEPGSSVSHWSTALAPNELMEPFDTGTTFQTMTERLFKDIGWTLLTTPTPTLSATPTPTLSATRTLTPTRTPTFTASPTPTRSPTPTLSPTPTPTRTATPTATETPTPRETCTPAAPAPSATLLTSGAAKCQRGIAKQASKFLATETKIRQRCAANVVKTGTGTCPDAAATNRIASAKSKLAAAIAKACGGADRTCGGDLTNEEPPAGLGWPATCPGLGDAEDPACSAAIVDCGDIAACIGCVGEAAVDQAVALYYDGLLASPPGSLLNRCQQAIGKTAARFVLAKDKSIQKCWDARLAGKHTGVCPDADAPDGSPPRKAALAIAKAERKSIAAICKACGGDDRQCDDPVTALDGGVVAGSSGDDDVTPAAIGFLPVCPTVKLPDGGPFCDRPVATLADLIECVDCVSELKVDCADRNRVPALGGYPCECTP